MLTWHVAHKYVRTTNWLKNKKIKETVNANNEHTMFVNEVQPILPTSPTAEQLQFLFIMRERVRFTMHNVCIKIIV